MTDYTQIITQDDIDNNMTEAVLENHALGVDGVAMHGDIKKVIDGEERVLRVVFEIREGEEQDNENIYTVDRIICANFID